MHYCHAAGSVSPSMSKTKDHINAQANFHDGDHLSGFGWGVFGKPHGPLAGIKQPRRRRFLIVFAHPFLVAAEQSEAALGQFVVHSFLCALVSSWLHAFVAGSQLCKTNPISK